MEGSRGIEATFKAAEIPKHDQDNTEGREAFKRINPDIAKANVFLEEQGITGISVKETDSGKRGLSAGIGVYKNNGDHISDIWAKGIRFTDIELEDGLASVIDGLESLSSKIITELHSTSPEALFTTNADLYDKIFDGFGDVSNEVIASLKEKIDAYLGENGYELIPGFKLSLGNEDRSFVINPDDIAKAPGESDIKKISIVFG